LFPSDEILHVLAWRLENRRVGKLTGGDKRKEDGPRIGTNFAETV